MAQTQSTPTVFDIIQLHYQDLTHGLKDIYEDKVRQNELMLEFRPDNAEKINYLNDLISSTYKKLDKESVAEMYTGMLKPVNEFIRSFELKTRLYATISDNNSVHPSIESLKHIADFGNSLLNLKQPSKDNIADIIKAIFADELAEIDLKEAANTKNPALDLAIKIIGYHFELAYLDYLNEKKREIQITDTPNVNMEKIEWLGTQGQLGELFVELKEKGWISEHNAKTISCAYTNSNTINQILQPGTDTKAGYKKTYPKIYTKRYKPVFSEIKPLTLSSKRQRKTTK